MKVVDKPDNAMAGKSVDEVSFAMANRKGSFMILSNEPKSRFEGAFFRVNRDFFRVIENFRHEKPVTKVINQVWNVIRERGELKEEFFMPLYLNSLVYELSENNEFELLLDCKQAYDDREWGRIYEMSVESKCIVIKFMKNNEEKEKHGREYELYMAICSDEMDYQPTNAWERAFYPADEERKSPPFERYVFNVCKLKTKKVIFSVSDTKKGAIKEAKYVLRNLKKLKRDKESHVSALIHRKRINDGETAIAYQCALSALDSMVIGDQGVMAGMPWFFQFWARDELICAKALMEIGDFTLVKKILFRHLDMIAPDATMPNRFPGPDLNAADAIGWLFLRFENFIDTLTEKKILKKYMSKRDMLYLIDRLHTILATIIKYRTENGLVVNNPDETWMDTTYREDSRDGARIEIQALTLAMLRLLKKIDKEDLFETELRETVRMELFDRKTLADGKDDFLARPNIFIAAYAYPELLTKKEWHNVFDSALPKLWLKWGGLSSIDKSHPLYTSAHTGQDQKSYHRGDSWFWINNLAALVLLRLDKKKYWKYISKIIKASVKEMLFMGVTGYSAEVSSAVEMKSQGCLCQAWSSAMFIELIGELNG